MTQIPIQLFIDPSDLPSGPSGPPGAGTVAEQKWATFAAGINTISTDLVPSGVYIEMKAVNATDQFEIDVSGVIGTSFATGTSVPIVLCRDGTPLLQPGQNFHSAAYVPTAGAVTPFNVMIGDAPGTAGKHRYELWFKAFAGVSYLGRRGTDAATFNIPVAMRVRRLLKPAAIPQPFTGLWYNNYNFYSGPDATFPSNQSPMGEFRAGKTYFTWADVNRNAVIAYYDHTTGKTSDVVTIGPLGDGDAHRNPSMMIDDAGYIYDFFGSHGDNTKARRSTNPLDISSWTTLADIEGETTYPQPHQLDATYISLLHRMGMAWGVRRSSKRGTSWFSAQTIITSSNPSGGVYAISVSETGGFPRWLHTVWTVLDFAMQTRKHFWYAKTQTALDWKRSDGTAYAIPIITEIDAEKIFDSGTDQVNTQDIQLDGAGNPYVLVSHGANGGNDAHFGGPWHFKLLKKKDGEWQAFDVAVGDHQFDNGSLVIHADDDFRALLPTAASQTNEDGGNIDEWQSIDQGEKWTLLDTLTNDPLSHNNVKTIRNHQPEFMAFWSYGDSVSSSEVTLRRYGSDGVTTIARS